MPCYATFTELTACDCLFTREPIMGTLNRGNVVKVLVLLSYELARRGCTCTAVLLAAPSAPRKSSFNRHDTPCERRLLARTCARRAPTIDLAHPHSVPLTSLLFSQNIFFFA